MKIGSFDADMSEGPSAKSGFEFSRSRPFIQGPLPFRVEYPFGYPGDSFRSLASPYNATCVAYHKNVDPRQLAAIVERGNNFRYGPGDERYETLKKSMEVSGFKGGDGQRIIVHVDADRSWIAEGNHRMKVALEVGVQEIEVEIRYLGSADEKYQLIPFDYKSKKFNVVT